MKKLFAATVLSFVLVLSSSANAFAAESTTVYNESTLQSKVQDFYKKHKNQAVLSKSDLEEAEAINNQVISFVRKYDIKTTGPYKALDYTETDLSKNIEASLNLDEPFLNSTKIATAFLNSNTARDAAKKYAKDNGYGDITWDNKADALRHFSWNFLMGKSIGVSEARTIANNHEIAGVAAANYINRSDLTYNEKLVYGTMYGKQTREKTLNDKREFNLAFYDPSIMDLVNNAEGRSYSSNSSYSSSQYLEAFNYAVGNSSYLITDLFQVSNTTRDRAWLVWYY
ncbi:hypothetical protein GK047_02570 [Paenibacillus sp. SYP-B3998]|uniref:DUF6973 domain-containing protein n=1 Tax=Paenibacillus sp. SYP-B3998 TaxID=2678564 RepID=A0A6G3ZTI7_9BACL|nr:hypothetical protein [Paenibacillus sp. SYP-B3998]NEW04901.1 hypothetical protein [Paenibacillus sp. SYP-B3998]